MTTSFPRRAFASRVLPLVLSLLLALSACGGGGDGGGTGADPITRVEVTGPATTLAVYETIDLTATAVTRSGAITPGSSIRWSSDRPEVAEVSLIGEVTGRAEGTATISCTIDGVTGSRVVTVTRAAIASVVLAPDTAVMVVGTTRPFTVTPRDVRGQPVGGLVSFTWWSDDSSVADLSLVDNQFVMTARKAGRTRVTITTAGKSDTATVTVVPIPVASVTITPASLVMVVGGRESFSATLRDGSGAVLTGRAVQWSSLDAGVAFPSGVGVVEGVRPGRARIVAWAEGKADTADVTVIEPFAVQPAP